MYECVFLLFSQEIGDLCVTSRGVGGGYWAGGGGRGFFSY